MKRSSPLVMPRKSKQEDEEISRKDAAKILHVSAATVSNYKIPFNQYVPRGKILYKLSDVLEFKENGSVKGKI